MTKNDITRGLIDFAVSQCLKNIKEDPYRSIRRLADLGRQFAKGRFRKSFFPSSRDCCSTKTVLIMKC